MITVSKDLPINPFSSFPKRFITICIVFLLFTCSCTPQEEKHQPQEAEISHIEINGFKVPHLPNASEQLFFAKVSDTHLPEQLALLSAVSLLFPQARIERGLAELEITYLQLGGDYRQSSLIQQNNTAKKYLQVAAEYQDIPEVAAKALWYHGWITADLLNLKTKGLISFEKIIKSYSHQQVSLSPLVSWTSINLEYKRDITAQDSSQSPLTWGELAYLELIRHGSNAAISLNHYNSLLQNDSKSSVIPEALTLLARRDDLGLDEISTIKNEIAKTELAQWVVNEITTLLMKKQAEVKR